ncbi:MAG: hypothetical protein KJ795_10880 [Gammaproteobacteria bacterium]|nr:hypothetical protein [Gammaproteobacteria bacterium]MBU1775780.1 hypothetical protein [Gammaproteobacteria bacterium]MBU1969278.1 hypothetical protein [Gammaproteobacteria bacterium]
MNATISLKPSLMELLANPLSQQAGKWLVIPRRRESRCVGWVEPFDFAQDRLRDTHQSFSFKQMMGIALLNPSYGFCHAKGFP